MPDTFDLHAAFRDLERDIAHVTHSPGAGHAVRGARRRRRTTIAAIAAAVLLVGGGVAVGQSAWRQDAIPPAGHLPAPAPLDGPHLTRATDGWTPAWSVFSPSTVQTQVLLQLGGGCLVGIRDRGGAAEVLSDSQEGLADSFLSDEAGHADQAAQDWRRLTRQMTACPRVTEVSAFHDGPDVDGRTYRLPPKAGESAPRYVWIVTTGTGIGELEIVGQTHPLPAENDRQVSDALLAAVQDPASYVDRSPGPSATQRVDEAAFARALGDWRNGWSRPEDRRSSTLDPPCYGQQWLRASWAADHLSLGGNGRQDLALYHSAADARAAATSLVERLRRCDAARYAAARPLDDPRSMLVVASGPTVVWVAQSGDTVGVVRVPSGGTAPPRKVSVDVGGLMFAAMEGLAKSTQ